MYWNLDLPRCVTLTALDCAVKIHNVPAHCAVVRQCYSMMAMRYGVTASQLRDEIYTHPSITEGLNEVLANAVPVN